MANWAWLAPKPRKAPHTRVVGPHGHRLDVDGRPDVRPAGVARGPLEDLHPHRGVRPRVADHPGPQGRQPALGVAAGLVVHADRVALGVDQQRLLAGQRALDRAAAGGGRPGRSGPGWPCPPCPRRPRRWRPARPRPRRWAGRAPRRSGRGRPTRPGRRTTPGARRPERGTARVDSGSRKACSTRWVSEGLAHDVGRPGQRGLDVVAAGVGGPGQHVAVEAPHRVLVAGQGGLGVDDRGQRPRRSTSTRAAARSAVARSAATTTASTSPR